MLRQTRIDLLNRKIDPTIIFCSIFFLILIVFIDLGREKERECGQDIGLEYDGCHSCDYATLVIYIYLIIQLASWLTLVLLSLLILKK